MPTLLRWNGYRFYFFSNEGYEPPHIHVDKSGCTVKFWLHPIKLAKNSGFRDNELYDIERKIIEQQSIFIDGWNSYFATRH